MSNHPAYRPNVNRNVTRKWADARVPDYGGDDWGDDGYDDYGEESQPAMPPQARVSQERRSFTNPMPPRGGVRSSFDRGDDRRYFSASAGGGFESAYPTAQRPPFPEPQHDDPLPAMRQQPPLQIDTHGQGPYPSAHHPSSSIGQNYPQHPNAPFSAPVHPSRRSQSGSRPSQTDLYGSGLTRSESRESNTSGKQFPPRKSSISSQQPFDIPTATHDDGQRDATAGSAKPLPFIRPADIYKRIEEEREKERQSQESSRPSIDSATGFVRDHSTSRPDSAKDVISPNTNLAPSTEDSDSARKLQPTLETVPERKSEYGFDNMLQSSDRANLAQQPTTQDMGAAAKLLESPVKDRSSHSVVTPISTDVGDSRVRELPSASSRYPDRPDPVSASTHDSAFPSRMASQQDRSYNSTEEQSSSTLPELGRLSTFGSDFLAEHRQHETEPVSDINRPLAPSTYRDPGQTSAGVERNPSSGYQSVVRQAFANESQSIISPTSSEALPRSNSASTSEISPIVARRNDPKLDQVPGEDLTTQTIPEEPRSPPIASQGYLSDHRGRQGPFEAPAAFRSSSRHDSPSPARRPLSFEAPAIPQPAQAVISEDSMATHLSGPGQAEAGVTDWSISGHDRSAGSSLHGQASSAVTTIPSIHGLTTQASEKSSPSEQRTASEEWREWSAARKEFNAKHGFKDSNPTTPGAPSSGIPSPMPRTESPPKMPTSNTVQAESTSQQLGGEPTQDLSSSHGLLHQRDSGLRPPIPGGWQSYNSLPGAETPGSTTMNQPRPPFAANESRTESEESIPTAMAPQGTEWRAQHAGSLNHPYPEAAAAGSQLMGIFSGPALTQYDSEANSVDESFADPTGSYKDVTSATHDFGAVRRSNSDIPATLTSAATRDFAADATPHTPQVHQTVITDQTSARHYGHSDETTPTQTTQSHIGPLASYDESSISPPQSSAEDVPAPLRTSRSSLAQDYARPPVPSIATVKTTGDAEDPDQLQEDIVKSLTPKSSHLENSATPTSTYHEVQRFTTADDESPQEITPRAQKISSGDNVLSHDRPVSPIEPASATNVHGPSHLASHNKPIVITGASNEPQVGKYPTQLQDFGSPRVGSARETSATNETPSRSFLEKRFSFEDDTPAVNAFSGDKPPSVSPIISSPGPEDLNSGLGNDKDLPSRPADISSPPIVPTTAIGSRLSTKDSSKPATLGLSPPSPISDRGDEVTESTAKPTPALDSTEAERPNISQISTPGRGFPSEKTGFRDIMNYSTSRERTQAFNDNRKLFAEPTGHLENWLTSMNTTEHADAFIPKGQSAMHAPASPTSGRTPPRREAGLPAGTRQMQEDGKKILAAAGKYGGKAGTAAKGLFARGKDKFRTVAQSDRRRSSGVGVSAPVSHPPPPLQQQISSISVSAPQIPASQLAMTPLDEGSWSFFSTKQNETLSSATAQQSAETSKVATNIQPSQPFSPVSDSSIGHQNVNHSFPSRSVSGASNKANVDNVEKSAALQLAQQNQNQPSLLADKRAQDTAQDEVVDPTSTRKEINSQRTRHERSDSLPVPHHRRHSSVSDVSSVSRDGEEMRNVATRTVSPPLDERPPEGKPAYPLPLVGKEQEARAEAIQEKGKTQPPLPPYDDNPKLRDSKIPPNAQIIPVARLKGDQTHPIRPAQPRPFSFMGSEEAYLPRGAAPQTDQSGDNPRSGSRLGSPLADEKLNSNSNIRLSNSTADKMGSRRDSQMVTAESPLPSARRPAEELHRQRQGQGVVPTQRESEEGYRIPGPYVQEYRSPKPKSSQLATPGERATEPSTAVQPPSPENVNQQEQRFQPPGPRPEVVTPEPERSRRGMFGGFFRPRSSSRSRDESERRPDFKQKRASLLRLQSGDDEQMDVVAIEQTLPVKPSNRRFSSDLLKPSAQAKTQGKKKRFSGLFAKAGSKEAHTYTTDSPASLNHSAYPQQTSPQQSFSQPKPMHRQSMNQTQTNQPFRGTPPPAGGYYGIPVKEYDPVTNNRPDASRENSHQRSLRGTNAWPQYHGYQPYPSNQQIPSSAPTEQRPDLRIDTRSYQHNNIMSAPPIANPQPLPQSHNVPRTRVNRDIDNYSGSQPSISQHVKQLHIRSRSPKLGPSSSDGLPSLPKLADEGTLTAGLGTFMNKKVSPVGGIPRSNDEQEKPWTIGLPGDEQSEHRYSQQPVRDPSSPSSAKAREVRRVLLERSGSPKTAAESENRPQTVADRFMGAQPVTKGSKSSSPSASVAKSSFAEQRTESEKQRSPSARNQDQNDSKQSSEVIAPEGEGNTNGETKHAKPIQSKSPTVQDHPIVAELSGSKPDGYESEEEIVMSATAYPGQEWQPVFDRWED